MLIEILDKKTLIVAQESVREHMRKLSGLGTKGKLNYLIDLCEGEVYQNTIEATRLAGIPHKWEW